MPNFEDMNETDVREIIVRPFLHKLGYQHGTEHNIRTEQTFRYDKAFLGRKNPKKDPALIGRADYILEIAGVGRWVAEIKAPNAEISRDDIEQAHTYAAHPEVAALYFLVTNGRHFRLYHVGSLDAPLMAWEYSSHDEIFLAVYNLLSPKAIRRKVKLLAPDKGKPLAQGVASRVQIIGGYVRYEDHEANHPFMDMDMVNGLELPITGGEVSRCEDGRLEASIKVAKAAPMMGTINEVLEREDDYSFYSSDEFISTDRLNPTLFQNQIQETTPAGTTMQIPGLGKLPLQFGFKMFATTEATGFIEDNKFKGTMSLLYEFIYDEIPPLLKAALEQHIGPIPSKPRASGGGIFEVNLSAL